MSLERSWLVSYVFPEGSKRSNVLTCTDERTTAGPQSHDKLPPDTRTHKHSLPHPRFPDEEEEFDDLFLWAPQKGLGAFTSLFLLRDNCWICSEGSLAGIFNIMHLLL